MTGDTSVQFTFDPLQQASHQHRCLMMLLVSNEQWCKGLYVQSFVVKSIETCGFTIRRCGHERGRRWCKLQYCSPWMPTSNVGAFYYPVTEYSSESPFSCCNKPCGQAIGIFGRCDTEYLFSVHIGFSAWEWMVRGRLKVRHTVCHCDTDLLGNLADDDGYI